jgi:hypothetical protein
MKNPTLPTQDKLREQSPWKQAIVETLLTALHKFDA